MKYIPLLFVALIVLSCSITKKSDDKTVDKKDGYFAIQIEQDGKILPPKNNSITLKKKPFKFKVEMNGVEDIFVSSSWDRFFYDLPEKENIFECDLEGNPDECRFMSGKVGVQTKFNAKKELMVGDRNYLQGWFYVDEIPYHRFDEGVTKLGDKIEAEFTVENIFDLDLRDKRIEGSKHQYKIEDINKEIYMVFATSNYIKESRTHIEKQREKLVLKFED